MTNDLFPESASLAEMYRTQIRVENEFTPGEIAELVAHHQMPSVINPLMEKLKQMMAEGSETPRDFRRRAVSQNVFLYEGQKSRTQNRHRGLLLCFCGNAQRLMMPIPLFLQHVPEDQFDVLLLRDPATLTYLAGIPEYSDTFSGCLERICDDVGLGTNYAWVTCYGTSGGGAAALYAGVYLNAAQAVGVGARHPSCSQRIREKLEAHGHEQTLVGAFDELIRARLTGAQTKLWAVFGEGCVVDRAGALMLQERLPGCTLFVIEGINTHGIMGPLLKRRALQEFLDRFVLLDPHYRAL